MLTAHHVLRHPLQRSEMRQVGIKEERRIHRNGENNGTRNLKIFGQAGRLNLLAGRLNLLAAEVAGARQAIISHKSNRRQTLPLIRGGSESVESNLPRGRTNINIWNNKPICSTPCRLLSCLLMASHQTGGLVRSVTDRTGQARLNS